MLFEKSLYTYIFALTLLLLVCVLIFSIGIIRHVPPGGDSNVYILDAYAVMNNNDLYPANNFNNSLQRQFYESPMSSLNLLIFHQVTGLTIEYPLFTLYQIFLLVSLFLSIFLFAQKIVGKLFGLLPILFFMNFQGVYFLFISSTIANFLAFIYVFSLLIVWQYAKGNIRFILSVIILLNVFLTHKSLTFIYLLLTIVTFGILQIRQVFQKLRSLNKYLLVIIISISFVILLLLVNQFSPLASQLLGSRFSSSVDKFQSNISFFKYVEELNIINIIFFIAFASAMFFKKVLKEQKKYFTFIIVWILIGFIITLLGNYGIKLYSSRILYMIIPGFAIASAYGFWFFINNVRSSFLTVFIFSSVIISVIITGVGFSEMYFRTTNFVKNGQIESLQLIKNNTVFGESILTNTNDMFPYFTSIAARRIIEAKIDKVLLTNRDFFKVNNIKYILITTGDKNGRSIEYYKQSIQQNNNFFSLLFENENSVVYKVQDI